MTASDRPTVVGGCRLALRLRKLVLAVWLTGMAVFIPAHLVVFFAGRSVRGRLPDHALPEGDSFLILVETLRPVAIPLALAMASACIALVAWSVLWHGGVVRWWMGAGAARVRLAEILGHGIVWWWRYLRLAAVGMTSLAVAMASIWLPARLVLRGADSGLQAAMVLGAGVALSVLFGLIVWAATLRGGWLLGESGRQSSLVAWLRGLGATLRRPLGSLFPMLVWLVPALVFLLGPFLVEPPWAVPVVLFGPLCAAFCWVALYLSYAPREPAEEWYRKMQARAASRVAAPADKPDPFKTGRIPTQPAE